MRNLSRNANKFHHVILLSVWLQITPSPVECLNGTFHDLKNAFKLIYKFIFTYLFIQTNSFLIEFNLNECVSNSDR